MDQNESRSLAVVQQVNRHMTPLAFVIVLGAMVSLGWNRFTGVSLAIVCMTVVANVLFVYVAGQLPKYVLLIRAWRMGFNYMGNAAIVFLLFSRWHPAWLLFLLAVIAAGVYHDQRALMMHAAACSVLLLAITYFYNRFQMPLFGEALTYAAVFWAIGLFVNRIVHLADASP